MYLPEKQNIDPSLRSAIEQGEYSPLFTETWLGIGVDFYDWQKHDSDLTYSAGEIAEFKRIAAMSEYRARRHRAALEIVRTSQTSI